MSAPAPVDEIDVGRDARTRTPWYRWSPRRRRWVGAGLAVLVALVAAGVWWTRREPPPRPQPVPQVAAPGADTVVDLGPDRSRCPAGVSCRYEQQVGGTVEAAFRDAFASAGYIGRQTVTDADTGRVYWDLVRFSTGTLVTVTLSQQPVALLPEPPEVDDTITRAEASTGSFTLTTVRDGYLMTVSAAGLPGQALPVRSARDWLASVPAP